MQQQLNPPNKGEIKSVTFHGRQTKGEVFNVCTYNGPEQYAVLIKPYTDKYISMSVFKVK